jgi:type I restriction enzyme S subunit
MAGEWPKTWSHARLGDVADVNWGDTSVTKASYLECGFPAYSATGPDGFLPYADYDRTGVILSAIGAECGRTWLARGKWSCIKNTIRFWSIRQDVDTEFLYWLTRDPSIWPKRGSAQPFISQGDARNLVVAYPPLTEQRAIAHILGTLDDKIELNRRMNETLEAMARALFKSWFVDFLPVRAKMEGRWQRGQSLPGLPAHLFDLWPDSFQDSPLGKIPKGWRAGKFHEMIELQGGGTPKTSVPGYWNGTIPWFSVVDAPRLSDVFVVDTEKKITEAGLESSSTKVLPTGTTVISARGTVGKLALLGRPMAMNQSCYGIRPRNGYGDNFTYFCLRGKVDELSQSTHGTVFDTITRDTFKVVDAVIPPESVTRKFDEAVRPFLGRILSNLLECKALADLRDTLLPKLISGELRVKDAERFVRRNAV